MALKYVIQHPEGSRLSFHNKAMALAEDYRKREVELFKVLVVIEEKRIYLDMQIVSLHQYCVEMLKLSRHTANDFINVVRKSKEIPMIREMIESERTTISKVRKVCSVITEKHAKEWLELTAEQSCRVVEKAVAMANPRSAVPEQIKYISGDTLKLQMAVTEKWADLLTEVKDLLSQKEMRAVTSEEALFVAMGEIKRKLDPVLKAERAEKRERRRLEVKGTETLRSNSSRDELKVADARGGMSPVSISRTRNIPASVRNELARRSQNQCEFVDRYGKRCTQKRWLQNHHVEHFAAGGAHTAENLQTLCWGHHCMAHR